MGCVPPQKRQQSNVAASIAVRKTSSKHHTENKSRSSTTSIQQNLQKNMQDQMHNSNRVKQKQKQHSNTSSPKFKHSSPQPMQIMNYNNRSPKSSQKISQKHSIRIIPPNQSNKDTKNGQLSKIASVHSLDLNSKIKISENSSKKIVPQQKKQPQIQEQRDQFINITFNNNNFATSTSSKGMAKRMKEEMLRQELKGMNDEHFRRVNVNSLDWSVSRI